MNQIKIPEKRTLFPEFQLFSHFTASPFNTSLTDLENPCNAPIIKKILRRPQSIQWKKIDKDTVDEIIFRTMSVRNCIMLELMARGGMRIGEVLKLRPRDIDDRKLIIEDPKSGRKGEVVFIPQKLLDRLNAYVKKILFPQNKEFFQSRIPLPG